MEITGYDLLAAVSGGVAIGIAIGHWFSKQERSLEYERGKLDGISFIWPYLEDQWRTEIIRRCSGNGKHQTDGCDSSGERSV